MKARKPTLKEELAALKLQLGGMLLESKALIEESKVQEALTDRGSASAGYWRGVQASNNRFVAQLEELLDDGDTKVWR